MTMSTTTSNLPPSLSLSRQTSFERANGVGNKPDLVEASLAAAKTKPKMERATLQDIGNRMTTRAKAAAEASGKPSDRPTIVKGRVVKPQVTAFAKRKLAALSGNASHLQRQPQRKEFAVVKSNPKEVLLHNEVIPMVEDVVEVLKAQQGGGRSKVEDIDKDDLDDPQLVAEYVYPIYIYLKKLEREQRIEPDYLKHKKNTDVLPRMRAMLVNWLVEVHAEFKLLQETLYLSVAILDRFVQAPGSLVTRKTFQRVGIAALFVAAKYEEVSAPELADFVTFTDGTFSGSDILKQEADILQVLDFNLGRPSALGFLRRNAKAGGVDARVYTLAKYILELALVEYDLAHVPPSEIAAASLVISIRSLAEDPSAKSLNACWTETLCHYSLCSWSDIVLVVDRLVRLVVKISEAGPDAELMAVRKKYSDKRYGRIAQVAQRNVGLFKAMKR